MKTQRKGSRVQWFKDWKGYVFDPLVLRAFVFLVYFAMFPIVLWIYPRIRFKSSSFFARAE